MKETAYVLCCNQFFARRIAETWMIWKYTTKLLNQPRLLCISSCESCEILKIFVNFTSWSASLRSVSENTDASLSPSFISLIFGGGNLKWYQKHYALGAYFWKLLRSFSPWCWSFFLSLFFEGLQINISFSLCNQFLSILCIIICLSCIDQGLSHPLKRTPLYSGLMAMSTAKLDDCKSF